MDQFSESSTEELSSQTLQQRIQNAHSLNLEDRKDLVFDQVEEVLYALLENENLTEEELKIIANRKDLTSEFLRKLTNSKHTASSYSVKRRLVLNPKLPASAGLKLISQLFLFDLVQVLITPAIPIEIKTAAENSILQQYSTISIGQKITMARRVNGVRLIPLLLNDSSSEVVKAALDNPFLTENIVANAIRKSSYNHVITLTVENTKWYLRRGVKLALLHSRYLPINRAITILQTLTLFELKELRSDPTIPQQISSQITQILSRSKI